jgi:CheY-like chemotaxis protein
VPAPASPGKGWRIIATDCDHTKLGAVTKILRDAGHCVFAAPDGRSALELVLQLPSIDLMLTSTRSGVMNGPELIRLVRYMRPTVRILHIAEESDEDVGRDVSTLREPFTPTQLLTALEQDRHPGPRV